ncbi:response regulator [Sphingomonas sp. G-3-2-10]|uniref:response regulator n=1 Tax=Sphingomonas sp. G-3-2-10 TaxID=2728838 RepID=UPI00146DD4D6|nr:response regulator [Sphingomonas sp. G-3-2-10]
MFAEKAVMPRGCIFIVDDDQAVRESTARLLHRADYSTQAYDSGDSFLVASLPNDISCVLLDLRMPGTDGLGVLRIMEARGNMPPVVVITGHGDIPLAVEAMRLGASDFLEKPYVPERLFETIEKAAATRLGKREARTVDPEAQAVLKRLSWRQRQVLAGILCGHPNKIIAYELGLSIRTIEAYRAQLLVRLQLRGTAEVVKFALAAGLDASEFGRTKDGIEEDGGDEQFI